MRIKIIACLLSLFFTSVTFGANVVKTLVKDVTGDITIKIGNELDTLYGNKKDNVQYGGTGNENFTKHQVKPNNNEKGILIDKDDIGCVILKIEYDTLAKDTSIIELKKAYYDPTPGQGWCPSKDSLYIVKIVKKKDVVKSTIPDTLLCPQCSSRIVSNDSICGNCGFHLSDKDIEKSGNWNNYLPYGMIGLLLIFVIGFVYLFKQLINLGKEINDLRKQVETNKKGETPIVLSNEPDKYIQLENRIKNIEGKFSDILNEKNYATTGVQQKATIKEKVDNKVKHAVDEYKFETTDVMYEPDSNSFLIKENPKALFRIYYEKGNYYYTIIDDIDAQTALANQLPFHENCLQYDSSINGMVSKVSPINPGRLLKDNDNHFIVDGNNKLKVKLSDR
ncbi:MAG: hypothetical protein IJE12_05795 [Prevotella sp.]|nr:hypothetical protein [Prevotella sp.]